MSNGQPTLLNTSSMTGTRQMRTLHRERRKAQLEKMRKPSPAKPRPDFVNTEMGLKGESREYKLLALACPNCGGKLSALEVKYPHGQDRAYYRVRCGLLVHCKEATPWLPSSQLAVRHWKLTAALSK